MARYVRLPGLSGLMRPGLMARCPRLPRAPCTVRLAGNEPVLKAWVEMVRNMVRTYALSEQTIKGRAEHRRKRRSLGEDVCGRLMFLKGQRRKERGRAEGTRRLPRTPVRRLRDYKGLITSIGEDVRGLLTQRGGVVDAEGRQTGCVKAIVRGVRGGSGVWHLKRTSRCQGMYKKTQQPLSGPPCAD